MAWEYRRLEFDLAGTLVYDVSGTDSTIVVQGTRPGVPNVFAALPPDYSTSLYLPLVISNDLTGKREVVWVTGHASGSTTLSVERAREGTERMEFEAGDTVRCAATLRDERIVVERPADLPADPHYGMRAVVRNLNIIPGQPNGPVVEQVYGPTGWVLANPIEPERYEWTNTNFSWPQGSPSLASGWVASANNPPTSAYSPAIGNGAVHSGVGTFALRKSGLWSAALYVTSTLASSAGWTDAYLDSQIPQIPPLGLTQHRSYLGGANPGMLKGLLMLPPFRYKLPTGQTASPAITPVLSQYNANASGITVDQVRVILEYLGP